MPPIPMRDLAPALALLAGALGALLCRAKGRRHWMPLVAPVAALLGWAVLVPAAALLRDVWMPRNGPALLLLPALAATGAAAVRGGRLARWAAAALTLFAAWWVAQSPAGQPEFWRVWAATVALAVLFMWLARREPVRGVATGTALWAGLALAGAAPGWREAALVMAGASAGVLPGGAGAALPAGMVAALVVAAELGAGRLVRGGVGLVEMACVAALVAPLLVRPLAGRLGRTLGQAGPLAAGLAAGAIAAGLGWVLQRALLR